MNTTQLFGIQFALKNKFKAQIVADFRRWTAEKQWLLTDEKNKKKLFEKVLTKYLEEHPENYRSVENIAFDLLEDLKVEAAKTNWEQVMQEELGDDYEQPDYSRALRITDRDTKELFHEHNCSHYYFTDNAVQECEKIHITEPLDMDWLIDIPDGKRQINFGNKFIRYEKRNNRIIAIAGSFTQRQECNYLQHSFFIFDLNTPKRPYDPMEDLINEMYQKELDESHRGFENKMRMLLYKMITFLDLTELKHIKIPAWGTLETPDELLYDENGIDPVYNDQNIPISVITVNINWNCSIYIEETKVTGYYRNTLCGKGKTKVIRRFVRPHRRSGYERIAGKLRAKAS